MSGFSFRSLIFCVFLSLSSTALSCSIDVGWSENPPFQFIKKGTLTGVDVDLMNALAKEIKCQVRYIKMPRKRQIRSIETGQLDLALGAIKTEVRSFYSHYTIPVRYQTTHLFFRGKSEVKNLDKIIKDGATVGLVSSSEYGPVVQSLLDSNPESFSYSHSNISNIRKLNMKRLDSFISERFRGFADAKSEKVSVYIHSKPLFNAPVFIMLSKKSKHSTELLKKMNMGIYAILSSKTYNKILLKYDQIN